MQIGNWGVVHTPKAVASKSFPSIIDQYCNQVFIDHIVYETNTPLVYLCKLQLLTPEFSVVSVSKDTHQAEQFFEQFSSSKS